MWRSFQLEPDSPADPQDLTSRLVSRYGMSAEEAAERNAHMTGLAAQAGLTFRLDIAKHGNTFAAHRVLHAARAAGLGSEAKERLLRGYFSEGRAISDPDTVVELAAEVGVEGRAALADERVASEVRADEREAAELGITGVPFFVLGRRYAVSGAQPPELLLQALEQAWADTMEV